MKNHFIIVCLFIFFFGASGYAQRMSRISGTVSDPDGIPIDLANVAVRGKAIGAWTDEKGFYSLSVETGDSCTLLFSCVGYTPTQRVIPSVDGDMEINIKMKSTAIELGEVTVRGQRSRGNTMDIIDAGIAKLSTDASGGNIESIIIAYGSGVSSTNELSSQYSVRGGSYDENIVYVNGIEIYRPLLIRSGQQEGLSFINPDMTGSVGFSSGGFEARYGDKMSSVLDITYKTPESLEGAVSGSFLGGNAYIGSKSGKFSQVTGLRYKRGSSLLKTLETKGSYEPTFLDLQTYMTYSFTSSLKLGVLGNISYNKYNFYPEDQKTSFGTDQNIVNFNVYYDGSEKDKFQTAFGAATLDYSLSDKVQLGLQLSGFQSKEHEAYDITSEYWLTSGEDDSSDPLGTGINQIHARNRLLLDVFNITHTGSVNFETNTLQWGIGYRNESIKDRTSEWEKRDSAGYSWPYDQQTVNMYYSLTGRNDMKSNRISGHIQDTYKFRISQGLFSLIFGIRGSYWDFNKEFIFSPRASVKFIPSANQNLAFRFATGLYYQAPFYKEYRKIIEDEQGNSFIELNENIKSQRSLHFVLGGDYTFQMDNRPFKFSTELYYKKIDDLIPYSVNNVRIRYAGENISDGYAAGIDLKLFGAFVPGIDSWLNVSLMRARQKVNGEQVPLPTDQPYKISLFFNDYFPNNERLTVNLRLTWSSGLPFSSPGHDYENSWRGKDYRRVDVGMAYLLYGKKDSRENSFLSSFKNIWLGIDAFNLFDIKNDNSYSWISDNTNGQQYAIPNRLTGRQLNFKLLAEF